MSIALPNKLSALLRLAVSDAQKCETEPGVALQMGTWLTARREPGGNETCYVCMAGAVMLRTLGVRVSEFDDNRVEPEFLGDDGAENAVYAIDALRKGELAWASVHLGIDTTAAQRATLSDIIQPELSDTADGYRAPWDVYLKAADYLEEQGL